MWNLTTWLERLLPILLSFGVFVEREGALGPCFHIVLVSLCLLLLTQNVLFSNLAKCELWVRAFRENGKVNDL